MLARLSAITVVTLLAFTGCKKKEEKKVDVAPAPMAGSDKPADMAGSGSAPAMAGSGSAPAMAGSGSAVAAGSGSAAPAAPVELKWEKYTSKDGGYTIELPSTPKEQDAQGMKIVGAEFGVTAADDRTAMCGVAFMDLPPEALKADPKVMLDGATTRHKQNATVIEEKDVKLGKNPGRSIVVKNDTHQKWMRAFIANKRIYILNCGGPFDRAESDGKVATKALDSFAFTK
ncbi:MAG: hypothetical protein M4D80_28545 [Myxococcota bacterium]|nr:hypothetical protein [Myxococcota bacterium]